MTVEMTAQSEALPSSATRFDRAMTALAYGYLTLPPLLFVLGWLRWYLVLPIAAALVVAYVRCLRGETYQSSAFLLGGPEARKRLLLLAGVVVLWFLLSGLGGYTYQNPPDHDLRNATFRDLVYCRWPVIGISHTDDGSVLADAPRVAYVYYLGHWLPSAAVGKVLGLRAGCTHSSFGRCWAACWRSISTSAIWAPRESGWGCSSSDSAGWT